MRTHLRLFRLTATTAIVGLALGPLLPQSGFAQPAPPPLAPALVPPAAAPLPLPQTTSDPPTRVGRLSRVVGQVSFHGVGADHWDAASLNFPVTSGDSFWTQPGASADLGITNNRLAIDQSTELDVATLDDHSVVTTIPQGQVYLRLSGLAPGETYTVTTPRGVVAITTPGRYEITAGDTQNPTRITVVDGAAQVSGTDMNLQVGANQTALLTGTDTFQSQVVQAQRDAFLAAQLSRERPATIAGGVTAPAIVAQMTGGEDLAAYGAWQQAPDYGQVWYPQVAAGYVPYRNGHWAFVQPWGWTWIDAAPWGFAPFHYGRWVQVGGRWGWAPGGGVADYGAPGYVEPVYAPALVTFFGIGAGVAVGAALAGGFGGNVGWCPLGWQEPYHPWYRTSPAYMRNVNVTSVRNITTINNTTTINNFANRGGATMVPASAMAASRPVAQMAHPIPAAQFANARPLVGRDPIAPTTATAGVTPRVAQEMHLAAPPPGAGPATRPAAPGPAIRGQAAAALPSGPSPAAAAAAQHAPVPPEETHAPGKPPTAEPQRAPGPPIASHAPTEAPALRRQAEPPAPRLPVEAARPATVVPGTASRVVTQAHPVATPAVAPHAAAPVQIHPQAQAAVPQVHPQVQAASPQVHPQPAAPQVHPQAEVHAPAPRVQAPQPAPAVVHAAPPPRPAPEIHNAQRAAPAPAAHPHPQERRQQSGQAGGARRGPHPA